MYVHGLIQKLECLVYIILVSASYLLIIYQENILNVSFVVQKLSLSTL